MNIEFKLANDPVIKHHIVVNGKVHGFVERHEYDDLGNHGATRVSWHACLDLRAVGGRHGVCGALAQGHGKTPEEAVRNAIVQSRGDAVAYHDAVNAMQAALGITFPT